MITSNMPNDVEQWLNTIHIYLVKLIKKITKINKKYIVT